MEGNTLGGQESTHNAGAASGWREARHAVGNAPSGDGHKARLVQPPPWTANQRLFMKLSHRRQKEKQIDSKPKKAHTKNKKPT